MNSKGVCKKIPQLVIDNTFDVLRISVVIVIIMLSNSNNLPIRSLQNDLTLDKLALSNQTYLKQAERKAMDDFVMLAEISAFLNVISSSEVGISFIADFNVTVGQALHEFTKGVERAAEVCLISLMSIESISVIVTAGDGVAPVLLQICLWSILSYLIFGFIGEKVALPKSLITRLRKISMTSLLVFVCFHLILPYSIHLSSITSHHLIEDKKLNNSKNLASIHEHLLYKGQQKDLRDRAEHSIHHLRNSTPKDLKNKMGGVIGYLVSNLALSFLEFILFPGVILYGLYLFSRYLIIYTRNN